MRTEKLTLKSGQEVEIRRVGPRAKLTIARNVTAALPRNLVRSGLDLTNPTESDVKRIAADLGDDGIQRLVEASQDNRIALVCACLVSPKVTPETIDDELDAEEFAEIEAAVLKLNGEVQGKTLPFSKAATGS